MKQKFKILFITLSAIVAGIFVAVMVMAFTGPGNNTAPAGDAVFWKLSGTDMDYSAGRIKDKTGFLVPVGAISSYAAAAAPSGWLICDGSAVSRTTYADLFTVIGTTYGVGNGSTTFNLPDLRGEFIRGFDNGRGVDTGRTLGSAQLDDFKAHQHDLPADSGSGASDMQSITPTANSDEGFNGLHLTASTGGTETRPRNIALNYIIKY